MLGFCEAAPTPAKGYLICMRTSMSKTWFITGAGRGFGVDVAKEALAAGHSVVATGRGPDAVTGG